MYTEKRMEALLQIGGKIKQNNVIYYGDDKQRTGIMSANVNKIATQMGS